MGKKKMPPSMMTKGAHQVADQARLTAKNLQRQAMEATAREKETTAAARASEALADEARKVRRRLDVETGAAMAEARRAERLAKKEDETRDMFGHSNLNMVHHHLETLRLTTEDNIDYIERTFIKEAKVPYRPTGLTSPKGASSPVASSNNLSKRHRSNAASLLAEKQEERKDPEEIEGATMYKKIKADQLCQLAGSMTGTSFGEDYDATVHRALDTYEEALGLCEDVLTPTHPLKVSASAVKGASEAREKARAKRGRRCERSLKKEGASEAMPKEGASEANA
jgi:hypothetical protein